MEAVVTQADLDKLAQRLRSQLDEVSTRADQAAKITGETHELVVKLNNALMEPPQGQDEGLLYQIAQMLDEWKHHKWAFQTVVYLAGAVISVAAVIALAKQWVFPVSSSGG